jgi:hypothetical protein
VSDQERDKLQNETQDEDGGEDVEAHKLSRDKLAAASDEEGGDDVEAHKMSGR